MTAARLDVELVRQGLARSRRAAVALVDAGRVRVDGRPARKPAEAVPDGVTLTVDGPVDPWVSRAAHKLLGALDDTGVAVAGRACLDAGASTGGFTQVLLARGARHVVAVDVGHGQIAPEVARDPRVTVREGVNVRDLTTADAVPPAGGADDRPGLVVADLSFISLRLALPPLVAVCAPGAELLVLVKPQFEVGRERLGRDGVVTSDVLRAEAVVRVADAAVACGAVVLGASPSRLAGENGNREHVLHLAVPASGPAAAVALDDVVATALERSVHDAVPVRTEATS